MITTESVVVNPGAFSEVDSDHLRFVIACVSEKATTFNAQLKYHHIICVSNLYTRGIQMQEPTSHFLLILSSTHTLGTVHPEMYFSFALSSLSFVDSSHLLRGAKAFTNWTLELRPLHLVPFLRVRCPRRDIQHVAGILAALDMNEE